MKNKANIPQSTYLIDKIRSLTAGRKKPLLVALDGRSGVGKSTMAEAIAQEVRGIVITGDDFFAGGPDSEWDARSTEAKVADCIDTGGAFVKRPLNHCLRVGRHLGILSTLFLVLVCLKR